MNKMISYVKKTLARGCFNGDDGWKVLRIRVPYEAARKAEKSGKSVNRRIKDCEEELLAILQTEALADLFLLSFIQEQEDGLSVDFPYQADQWIALYDEEEE